MQEPISQPLLNKSSQRGIVLAIGLGTLVTSFDSSAVGSILPIITNAFHSNVSMAKWVVTSYYLTISALVLGAGRLGDLLGHRRLYLSGLSISFIGALMCASAPSIGMLAIFRVVAGIGAALVLGNAAALLTKWCASKRSGRMLGLLSTMAYLGLIIGPSLSGLLSGTLGWRWVFIVVSLFAAMAFLLGTDAFPSDGQGNNIKHLDILQTILLTLVLGSLVLAFHWSDRSDWQSWRVLSCVAAAVVAMIIMVCRNTMYGGSTQYIEVLFNRTVALASVTAMLSYAALYSVTFVLPFYFFNGQAFDPVKIGLILSVRPMATALLAPLSGMLTDRYGTRIFSFLGLLILLLSLITLSLADRQSQMVGLIFSLAGIGIGMGIFLPPNHKLIMSTASLTNKGVASAILSLTRNMGMLIGTSLSGAFFLTPIHKHAYVSGSTDSDAHMVFYISACIAGVVVLIMAVNSIDNFMKQSKTTSAELFALKLKK